MDDSQLRDPMDEDERPIPGTPYSRLTLVAGLLLLLLIVGFLVWFIASNSAAEADRPGLFGWSDTAAEVRMTS